jgi:hypothetical protein
MMDRTRWEMYDSSRWLLTSSGFKSSVKFIHFTEYGKWNDSFTAYNKFDDAKNTTALGFMRYYLSARAEALKPILGKAAAEEPPVNTTGTTATTTQTQNTTQNTSATLPSQGGADSAKPNGNALVIAYVAIPAVIGAAVICLAVYAKSAGKKRKNDSEK